MRIGIDLGGTKTEGILLDSQGQEQLRVRYATPQLEGYTAVVDNIVRLVRELELAAGQICPVGIGTPGAISAVTGRMKNSNTQCLNGQPLWQDLQRQLRGPLKIANDANCFALSEACDGAGQGFAVVFGVIMGTGVGGGLVFHQQLHAGRQHIAGEWGHNSILADGPPCYCGKRGCVETLISGPALARSYHQLGGSIQHNTPQIVALAEQGDPLATQVMAQFYQHFGQALATVLNIVDPDVVVLGGGLSNLPGLYQQGRQAVADYLFNDEFTTPIVPNVHGDSSGVRGAAQLWAVGEWSPADSVQGIVRPS